MKEDSGKLRRLNLNLLYALNAVLCAETLTDAGRMISLSQPAMSMALKKLRDQFGDELVVYSHGERSLTALGKGLLPRVTRLLQEADDTFNLQVDFDPRLDKRDVVLAAPEAVELTFLRRVVPSMLRDGPNLKVRLVPFNHTSVGLLFRAGVDIAIVPEPLVDNRYCSTPLFDHGTTGLIWSQHESAGLFLNEAEYLSAKHAALLEGMESVGSEIDDYLLARRHVVVRTGLYSMLPALVIGTQLVVTTSSWLAQYYASIMPVKLVGVPVQSAMSRVYAQWPNHRDEEPYINWLVEKLVSAIDWEGGRLLGRPGEP